MSDVILTNLEHIPGKQVTTHLGLVQGNTVRAKHIGRDIASSLKNIVGGELHAYTELLTDSRQQAVDRMVEAAEEMGANAVVNIRFSTSSVSAGASELYVYGTAVIVD
ncbi:MAG: YbjQ family protein [Maricaulaceae bacterium]